MSKATSSKPKLIHIFAPGVHTAMSGEVIEFSQADIAATAKAYNPALYKAPLVIGHPKTDDPAQGWAARLDANVRGLFAEPMKVDAAFAQSVNDGRWGTVSSKFYRPTDPNNPVPGVWYLRHIGFLGAASPAVKGLDSPAFAQTEDDGCVCFTEGVAFSEWDDVDNASLWRNLREWFIGKFGQAEADTVIPSYKVQSLEQGAQDEIKEAVAEAAVDTKAVAEAATPQFSEPQPPKEPTVTPQEKAALEAENAALKAQLAAHQASVANAANVAFCESLMGIPAAAKPVFVAALNHLDAQATPVEFGEGDAKAPLASQLKAALTALPPLVQFGEHATHERAAAVVDTGDAEAIAAKATAYQAEAARNGNQISYPHAVSQVVRGH